MPPGSSGATLLHTEQTKLSPPADSNGSELLILTQQITCKGEVATATGSCQEPLGQRPPLNSPQLTAAGPLVPQTGIIPRAQQHGGSSAPPSLPFFLPP